MQSLKKNIQIPLQFSRNLDIVLHAYAENETTVHMELLWL